MKKLCFGTLFTLLWQIKSKGTQPELYKALVYPNANPNDTSLPQSSDTTNRKIGKMDITASDKATFIDENISLESIILSYRKNLSPLLKNTAERKAFIIAIQDVIKEDLSLEENTIIGTEGNTKKEILNKNVFDFFALVANIMVFCSSIDNSNCINYIKEITPTFIKERIPLTSNIYLDNITFNVSTPLISSIDNTNFADTFIEINPDLYGLSLPNPNKVKIYKLQVHNKEFDYSNITTFIQNNLAFYIYSRTKRKDLEESGNPFSVGVKAVIELNKTKYKNNSDNFCEIMLYSFLECAMKSPKILSGYEIEKSTTCSNTSGIYLLPAGTISPNNQIIFGCSKAHQNIEQAIDDVVEQAYKIKTSRNAEIKLLDPTILRATLEPAVSEYVKNIIVPNRKSIQTTDDAFGAFISYTIDVPNKNNLSNHQYCVELDKKMDKDILNAIPYIKNKIETYGLNNYSFYFFVLPLNNAEIDPQVILNQSTGVSDV